MAIGEVLLGSGVSAVIGKLTEHYVQRPGALSKKVVKENIEPHIRSVYTKCSKVKTLLNPNRPTDFLAIYNDQRFRCGKLEIDQFGLVERCRSANSRTIVSGTGGSGKSMFLKYLWISFFESSDGRIPIFVELRNINSFHTENIEAYLHYTINQGEAHISDQKFRSRLKQGDFLFILDGFDEVNSNKKDSVKRQILDISNNYPNCSVIISSRPEEGLVSWSAFDIFEVCNLSKDEAKNLVLKAEFDEAITIEFAKKLEDDFYDRFSTFLSNPLLCSIMLLTYSYNLDLPSKMHLFYDQAFNALYRRHDSYKDGGYEREFSCDIAEDEFRKIFAYFCLISYNEQKFEFTDAEIKEYLNKAISVVGSSVNSESYLRDVCSSVCLIIKDGLIYTFSHRSFQEYFSAYAICYYSIDSVEEVLVKFAARKNDQVLSLVFDMKPNVLREKYIIPVADRYRGCLGKIAREETVKRFAEAINIDIHGRRPRESTLQSHEKSRGRPYAFSGYHSGELSDLLAALMALDKTFFEEQARVGGKSHSWVAGDERFLRRWLGRPSAKDSSLEMTVSLSDRGWRFVVTEQIASPSGKRQLPVSRVLNTDDVLAEFKETGVYRYIVASMKAVAFHVEALKEERERERQALSQALKL